MIKVNKVIKAKKKLSIMSMNYVILHNLLIVQLCMC